MRFEDMSIAAVDPLPTIPLLILPRATWRLSANPDQPRQRELVVQSGHKARPRSGEIHPTRLG